MIPVLALLFACGGSSDGGADRTTDPSQPKELTPGGLTENGSCPEDLDVFEPVVWDAVMGQTCIGCHSEGAVGSSSAFSLGTDMLANLRMATAQGENLVLKPTGLHPDGHGGGEVVSLGSVEHDALQFWVDWGQGICADAPTDGCFEDEAPRRLRRLTQGEYARTLEDLLGIQAAPIADALAADPEVDGFKNDAEALVVGSLLADQYRTTAEQVVWDAPLPAGCDPDVDGAATCAQERIEDFGFRAFRRPLAEEELDAYVLFWNEVAQVDGFDEGMRWTMAAMLQSPHFLYRSELGVLGDDGFELTDWELATELSYSFWGTMPDDELFAAAEAGFDDASLQEQVDRLAADPRALDTMADMVEVWLHLDLLETVSREGLEDSLRDAMAEETRTLVKDVAGEGGTLADLFTARHTTVDDQLAAHYGLEGTGRVELDGERYGGLLTQGSVLTAHARPSGSSPIHRGVLVRERLLCEHLPPPPSDLDTSPPPVDPNLSTRERYAQHATDPACAGCHDKIDLIGFGFEAYDGLGRWRDDDAGHAIDDSGDVDGAAFVGPFDLAELLLDDARVRTCFVETWRRHATGGPTCATDPGHGVRLMDPLLELPGLTGFRRRVGGVEEGDSLAVGVRPSLEPLEETDIPDGAPADAFALNVNNDWGTGYCAEGVVTNTTSADWTWEVRVEDVGSITSAWNGEYTLDGPDALFVGVDWNGTIPPGGSASFGFCADR